MAMRWPDAVQVSPFPVPVLNFCPTCSSLCIGGRRRMPRSRCLSRHPHNFFACITHRSGWPESRVELSGLSVCAEVVVSEKLQPISSSSLPPSLPVPGNKDAVII